MWHSPNNNEVLLRIYLLCMAMWPKDIVILFYCRAHLFWCTFCPLCSLSVLSALFNPNALSEKFVSQNKLTCHRQTLWTQLPHRPQLSMDTTRTSIWNGTFCKSKKKKKSCLAQSDVTVQYLCHARLDSPSRTAPVCRLPPLFAWFVSSSAGSSGVSGTSWVWPDSVASLWTAEVLLLSNSRSASSWRPWAGRSMTAPDRAAADRDTLTPDEWRSRYSCGLYILHRDAPWMHTAWSD